MSLPYAYTTQIWPSILMVALMIALSFYSGRRRSVPGATALMITSLFAAAWAAGSLLEKASLDLVTKIAWFKVQAVIQLPIITGITCFILEYTWPGRWLTRRNLALSSLPIILFVGMILTNDRYHLAWRGFSVLGTLRPEQGPGSWLMGIYFWVVLEALNLIVLGWVFLRSPQHRWPVVLMLVGQFTGRSLFLIDRFYISNSVLPLDLLGMSFEFLMYTIVLSGFRILDPIPLARQTVIQQLHTGMLVLDPQDRVVSLNPAAQAILGRSEKLAVNHSIQELLPACAGWLEDLEGARTSRGEISLPEMHPLKRTSGTSRDGVGAGVNIRNYQVETSPLNDWRGLEVGRLLLLHDVTEQKRAQAQLLEQQQALATLRERERLARELHDGIGQVLGYVKLQAQAARDRLAVDQKAEVDRQLAQLIAVAQDAHADVREYILGAKTAASTQGGFLAPLRQYLERFSQQNALPAELRAPPDWRDDLLEPSVAAQLLRVIQEALTNARKHARAHCTQVTLQCVGDRARVTVEDDGVGFDPALLSSAEGQRYGLGFMRERAEEVGGSVWVESAPGQGTRVVVEVPVNSKR